MGVRRDDRLLITEKFEAGSIRFLISTDTLDDPEPADTLRAQWVVNYDCPSSPEDYVRRVRQARQVGGGCIVVNLANAQDALFLRDIESNYGLSYSSKYRSSSEVIQDPITCKLTRCHWIPGEDLSLVVTVNLS